MINKIVLIIPFWIYFVLGGFAQNTIDTAYYSTYHQLKKILEDEASPNFQRAVFMVENSWWDKQLNEELFDDAIDFLARLAKAYSATNAFIYEEKDSIKMSLYGSIFKVLTDTTHIISSDKNQFQHLPFYYDFEDSFGDKDWSKMFVSKLLTTKSGNCHSLPYLYKMIANKLAIPCHFALAPNHLYIKHQSKKGGWYNVELTSAAFPIDAWLMASGYITLEAIQNGIYMDTLSQKEDIALCVIDLAQGYDKKYPDNDGTFIIQCCDLALKYFPNYINALILKAETRKKQLETLMKIQNVTLMKDMDKDPQGRLLRKEMNELYMQIHQLGYRTMPQEMYLTWMDELQKEKEKYGNKKITNPTQNHQP